MPINNSNLPTLRTFKREDFPEAPDWFGDFLQSLVLFSDPVYQLLNGNITYQNLAIPKIFTKIITAPATGSVTFNFTNPLRTTPVAILPGNVYVNGQPSSHPSSPVSVFWHVSQNVVYIDNITNLTASTTYSITLVIF